MRLLEIINSLSKAINPNGDTKDLEGINQTFNQTWGAREATLNEGRSRNQKHAAWAVEPPRPP